MTDTEIVDIYSSELKIFNIMIIHRPLKNIDFLISRQKEEQEG